MLSLLFREEKKKRMVSSWKWHPTKSLASTSVETVCRHGEELRYVHRLNMRKNGRRAVKGELRSARRILNIIDRISETSMNLPSIPPCP